MQVEEELEDDGDYEENGRGDDEDDLDGKPASLLADQQGKLPGNT